MVCLSQEQLAQLALGLEGDADLTAHLEECAHCRASLVGLQSLIDELSAAHNNLNRGHAQSRARLLANLPVIDGRPQPASVRQKISSWFGELNMKQRMALSGVSVTVVLGLLFVWSAFMAKPVSAMELLRENLRKAKSYKMKMITEARLVRKPGQPPEKISMTGMWYWLAPGSVRTEMKRDKSKAGLDQIDIYPAGKAGIHIDQRVKTYRRVSSRRGQISPIMMLEGLRKYSGKADRKLGTKKINGKKVLGFVIDAKKIDPDAYAGPMEIWIDAETNLPAEIRIEMKAAQVPMTLRLVDFQWNIELDAKLFDARPPVGFTDATPKPPSLQEQVRVMSEAFKLYAKLSGGHYPRVKIVYGDVTRDEMQRMAGFKGQPTPDQLRNKKYVEILKATRGLATINGILRDNADSVYYGRTVGPKDKDKVLLRWKLDDGRFHVMYGDLRGETVTAKRMQTLEGR